MEPLDCRKRKGGGSPVTLGETLLSRFLEGARLQGQDKGGGAEEPVPLPRQLEDTKG